MALKNSFKSVAAIYPLGHQCKTAGRPAARGTTAKAHSHGRPKPHKLAHNDHTPSARGHTWLCLTSPS